jgi:ATP-dependent DNA helicase RecQ
MQVAMQEDRTQASTRMDMDQARTTLREIFGFPEFRPHQEEVIEALLARRDLFAVMPTGAGKSLCYQLPALLLPGTCLVVSPLISLMKDQVDAAKATGLQAAFLNSTQSVDEQQNAQTALLNGTLDLLYISPERFAMPSFSKTLARAPLSFVAIDEAHCISEWGHDFWPDYLQLSRISKEFPYCPIAAFTATATHKVAEDIITKLGLRRPHQLRASFNRSNLFYEVLPKTDTDQQLLRFVRSRPGEQGIIYRMTRKSVEATAGMLCANGIKALPYHAGLDDQVRAAHQEAFSRDDTDVIVATIAFGMGIDKSNVRFVVHGDLPKNIESYYQETGRAGRDGEPAHCLLLFGHGDAPRISYFIDKIEDRSARNHAHHCLQQMLSFGASNRCRRKQLLAYFNEQYPEQNCGMCDICAGHTGKTETIDASKEAQMLMSAMIRTGNRFGARHIIDIVKGANTQKIRQFGHNRIKTYEAGKNFSKHHLQDVFLHLESKGLVQRTDGQYPTLQVSAKAAPILQGEPFYVTRPKQDQPTDSVISTTGRVMDCHIPLFEQLRELRKHIAEKQEVPPFVVFSDRSLREMAASLPSTADAMLQINGVGKHKMEQYGKDFLATIQTYQNENPDIRPIPLTFKPKSPSRTKNSAKLSETLSLLQQGLGIDEIAETRGLKPGTIVSHIERLIEDGNQIELTTFVSKEHLDAILEVFLKQETQALKPVFEHFGGKVSYDEIRLARAYVLAKGAEPLNQIHSTTRA